MSAIEDAKTILVIGATSGIGEQIALTLSSRGKKVIVSGRREENLKKLCSDNEGMEYVVFDVTKLSSVKGFVDDAFKKYEIDAVFINSGIQRSLDFNSDIDLEQITTEFTTNYTAYLYLTTYILPYFKERKGKSKGAIFYTGSGLGYIPLVRCPNYCATKAALHQFLLCIRQQLKDTVRIVEICPPAVESELHDEKHQPDLDRDAQKKMDMPLKDFIHDLFKGIDKGEDEIAVGMANKWKETTEPGRQKVFKQLNGL